MIAALPSRSSSTRAPIQTMSKIRVVQRYLDALNARDAETLRECFDCNADVVFANDWMGVDTHIRECAKVFEAFPDIRFYGVEPEENADGDVVLDGLLVKGTHKKPYGCGPFPEIPATGIECVNDPEKLVARVENGKITKLILVARGEFTGPSGFYRQIGGVIA